MPPAPHVRPGSADSAADVPKDLSGTPGFDVRLLDGALIVTEVEANGAAAAAGVRTGWKVQAIDGGAVAALLAELPESLAPRLGLRFARLHACAWADEADRGVLVFEDLAPARQGDILLE